MWAFSNSEMIGYIQDMAKEHLHPTVAAYLASADSEQLEDSSMYAEVYYRHCTRRARAAKSSKTCQKWRAEIDVIERHFEFLRATQA